MSLNAKFDEDPEGYEAIRQCWLNSRRTMFIKDWLRSLALPPGARVLEIGSGTGLLLRNLGGQFPAFDFTGLEPIAAYVDFASARRGPPNVRFVPGTAETAGKSVSGPFHAILSNDVLHHVESVGETVSNAAAISARGCRWLAIEPNPANPYVFCSQSLRTGEKNFRPAEFLGICGGNGWRLTRRGYIFAIPPFVKEAPDWMTSLERRIEGFALIAGGIRLDLEFPRPSRR